MLAELRSNRRLKHRRSQTRQREASKLQESPALQRRRCKARELGRDGDLTLRRGRRSKVGSHELPQRSDEVAGRAESVPGVPKDINGIKREGGGRLRQLDQRRRDRQCVAIKSSDGCGGRVRLCDICPAGSHELGQLGGSPELTSLLRVLVNGRDRCLSSDSTLVLIEAFDQQIAAAFVEPRGAGRRPKKHAGTLQLAHDLGPLRCINLAEPSKRGLWKRVGQNAQSPCASAGGLAELVPRHVGTANEEITHIERLREFARGERRDRLAHEQRVAVGHAEDIRSPICVYVGSLEPFANGGFIERIDLDLVDEVGRCLQAVDPVADFRGEVRDGKSRADARWQTIGKVAQQPAIVLVEVLALIQRKDDGSPLRQISDFGGKVRENVDDVWVYSRADPADERLVLGFPQTRDVVRERIADVLANSALDHIEQFRSEHAGEFTSAVACEPYRCVTQPLPDAPRRSLILNKFRRRRRERIQHGPLQRAATPQHLHGGRSDDVLIGFRGCRKDISLSDAAVPREYKNRRIAAPDTVEHRFAAEQRDQRACAYYAAVSGEALPHRVIESR